MTANLQPVQGWDYDTKMFREAATKKEQCNAKLFSMWGPNPTYEKLPLKEMEKDYHEYCPKSKSNNLIFCPKSIIKKRNDVKVQWINDYFNNYGKKSVKKYYRKKSTKKYYGKKSLKKYYGKKSKSKYYGKKGMKEYYGKKGEKKYYGKKSTKKYGKKGNSKKKTKKSDKKKKSKYIKKSSKKS